MAIKKIDIEKLKVGMLLVDPVYGTSLERRILLLPGNTLITNNLQIRRLITAGLKTVQIDTDRGIDTFHTLLDQKKWKDIKNVARNRGTPDAIIARHISNFVNSIIAIISKNTTSRILIREEPITAYIKDIVLFIENHIDILLALIRLKAVSEYTYSHAVKTMVLCLSLAYSLKLNFSDIKRFGIGALLSDLGMTSYPSRMITRPSGLSKKEIEEIKKHPLVTVQFLKNNGIDDPLIETIIAQHHERFDGTGYPKGLKGNEIHTISKLFSIADVFEAMTSGRPHRKGIPPHMVLSEILDLSGVHFDPKISKLFIKYIGVFPVGNMVELTGGKLALVAGQNKSDPLRPLVIVFHTKRKIKTSGRLRTDEPNVIISRGKWELVDLAIERGTYGKILRGLDHRKFQINPAYYMNQI